MSAHRHSRRAIVGRPTAFALYFALVVSSIVSVVPLIWAVLSSFKSVGEIYRFPPTLLPEKPTLIHYQTLFGTVPIGSWLMNSVITVTVATVVAILVSAAAGYAFAKFDFRGSRLIYALILGSIAVPFAVILTPLFAQMADLELLGNPLAMTIPYLAPPLGVIAMRQYAVASVPNEVLEAARMDGAGELHIFARIAMPMLAPGVVVVAIWAFFNMFIAYLWPIVVATSTDQLTLTAGVGALATGLMPQPGLAIAGAVIGAIPTLVLLFALRKHFTQGLAVGALKG